MFEFGTGNVSDETKTADLWLESDRRLCIKNN